MSIHSSLISSVQCYIPNHCMLLSIHILMYIGTHPQHTFCQFFKTHSDSFRPKIFSQKAEWVKIVAVWNENRMANSRMAEEIKKFGKRSNNLAREGERSTQCQSNGWQIHWRWAFIHTIPFYILHRSFTIFILYLSWFNQ